MDGLVSSDNCKTLAVSELRFLSLPRLAQYQLAYCPNIDLHVLYLVQQSWDASLPRPAEVAFPMLDLDSR